MPGRRPGPPGEWHSRWARTSLFAALLGALAAACNPSVPSKALASPGGGQGTSPRGASGALEPPELTADAAGPRDWAAHPAIAALDVATDVYAMGDVHGDPDAQLRTLRGAGLVSGSGPVAWTGGQATLVVTGDVIDKGVQSIAAIDNFRALEADAASKGGRVVVLMGNHEAEFLADPEGKKHEEFNDELRDQELDPEKVARDGRGRLGRWLHTRPFAATLGDWFFSHAGDGAARSAAALGQTFTKWWDEGKIGKIADDPLLQSKDDWWWDKTSKTSRLDDVLAALPARHLVYGHQPGKVDCHPGDERPKRTLYTCYDGKVFFLDVGMSSAVDPASKGGLLHIQIGSPSRVTALYPDGSRVPVWSGAR